MKVLIWTQYFWPENFRINELVTTLRREGIDVTVLTGKPNYPSGRIFPGYRTTGIQREEFSGAEVIRIPLLPRGNGSFKGLLLNYLSFIFSGYLFPPFALRRKKFDAIFVYAPSPLLQALPAIFIAWIKGAPLIIWVQDIWPEALQATGFIKNSWLLWLVELTVRYIYRSADSILIQSKAFRPSVERLAGDKRKIHFYPNSSEDFVGSSDAHSPQSGVASEIEQNFSVVFAGNIGSVQSCNTIISAAKLLLEYPQIIFYLVGSGSQAASIASDIKSTGLNNVVMTGQLHPCEMPAIFAAASILLITLADVPGIDGTIPSKLQSYLAAGKPIIASMNGEGARMLLDANAGIVCPAEDANALACAVKQMHEMSPDERARFGQNGRVYFKTHFDMARRARELITHFENISGRK
ncbi:MAG: glycosyltransferase family 4 protein [Burkholderiales bacterium]|nr:glycosyltransferase family 4 protein [Burkholderiales bacterium]